TADDIEEVLQAVIHGSCRAALRLELEERLGKSRSHLRGGVEPHRGPIEPRQPARQNAFGRHDGVLRRNDRPLARVHAERDDPIPRALHSTTPSTAYRLARHIVSTRATAPCPQTVAGC